MKTDIYGLLGMIKDGKAPKKIMYDNKLWEYDVQDKDYWTNHYDGTEWLFDEYVIPDILNEEVEILETTITYNQDEPTYKKIDDEWYVRKDFKPNDNIIFVEREKQDDKIEKLKIITKKTECGHNHHYLVNDNREYRLREVDKIILDKINEIIDYIHKV